MSPLCISILFYSYLISMIIDLLHKVSLIRSWTLKNRFFVRLLDLISCFESFTSLWKQWKQLNKSIDNKSAHTKFKFKFQMPWKIFCLQNSSVNKSIISFNQFNCRPKVCYFKYINRSVSVVIPPPPAKLSEENYETLMPVSSSPKAVLVSGLPSYGSEEEK